MSKIGTEDIVLVVCNPIDGCLLVENDQDIAPSLVITEAISPGEVIMVKKDEFLNWLKEEGESQKDLYFSENEENEEDKNAGE